MNKTDNHRVVILADTHIGAERRPWLRKLNGGGEINHIEYDQPAQEAMKFAADHNATTIIAGDMYDRRTPTPSDYVRGSQLQPTLVVTGNHDIPATVSPDALWNYETAAEGQAIAARGVMRGQVSTERIFRTIGKPIQIVGLPWPRSVDWPLNLPCTIESEISQTREFVLNALAEQCEQLDTSLPALLVGHALVSYGNTPPDDPGLLLGKDVVLPYEALTSLPNIGGVYLGHVHDPSSPAYVGSTQPTDWGEWDQVKSFTVVDIVKAPPGESSRKTSWRTQSADMDSYRHRLVHTTQVNGWLYHTYKIPYETSLKLVDCEFEYEYLFRAAAGGRPATGSSSWPSTFPESANFRCTIKVPANVSVDPAVIANLRITLDRLRVRTVEILIEHEAQYTARVVTPEPMATMRPVNAIEVWLEQRSTDSHIRTQVVEQATQIMGNSKE